MSHFQGLIAEPTDPVLASFQSFLADNRPEKENLSVGVYYNEDGRIPIMAAVTEAELRLAERPEPWGYLMLEGLQSLRKGVSELVFGHDLEPNLKNRVVVVQSLGGTGALRLGAELQRKIAPLSKVALSKPTWSNHVGVFQAAGLHVTEYPYYDSRTNGVNFAAMCETIAALEPGTMVVLHACCHNPTGVDLNPEQWEELASLLVKRALVPFLDMAYAGFGEGLTRDTSTARLMASKGLPLFLAVSFSKNFSLYGERVGALCVVTNSTAEASLVMDELKTAARTAYTSPPSHGALLVSTILSDPNLRSKWEQELESMRLRITMMRRELFERLVSNHGTHEFDGLLQQKGLFSYSGLTASQIDLLRVNHAVHAVSDGRICIAALNKKNLDRIAAGMLAVLKER